MLTACSGSMEASGHLSQAAHRSVEVFQTIVIKNPGSGGSHIDVTVAGTFDNELREPKA
jgi:hypothetical protein